MSSTRIYDNNICYRSVNGVGNAKTGGLYAMKTLRKSHVVERKQVAHVIAEKDILAEADNDWIVKLYYSFQVGYT